MPRYSVATSKDKLSALIDRALAGEEVVITRHGKPAAKLVPPDPVPSKKDVRAATERLRERLIGQPKIDIPIERFRDWLYAEDDD